MLAGLLAGCAAPPPAPPVAVATQMPLPRVMSFGTTELQPPTRSNAEMARDFLDLSFQLESGQALPVFTRFEEPITIAVTGLPSAALEKELRRLTKRLESEAGLDVRRTADPATATVTIEGVSTRDMQRSVPAAACFVLPTRITWDEFRRAPRSPDYSWTRLTRRSAVSAFVPVDTSQQEIRDCLHEEIAQGLGPLNDLYRLGDSVFNDDNLNPVLTGFDMLMLRATYSPMLRSGMSREEVAAKLPAILDTLNPRGRRIADRGTPPSSAEWKADISRALSPGSTSARRAAAGRAASESAPWGDVRSGFSLFTLGRMSITSDPETALNAFLAAQRIFESRPETKIHAAHAGFQIAAFALNSGQFDIVLDLTESYIPVARRHEDAALLSDLELARAAALAAAGRPQPDLRREALAWGVYAYGTAERAAARAREIETLAGGEGA
ncbi:DUF2927 domain-containing protein [Mangrovicoccus sp. HB182678]|uniref:DUF2927 domain-containing protein n=2 Tax=Mangrovicoccus algicola TaxID=2771008 RepID=A0A8J7CIM5_9RHOB|nr:DUF2927 domain-containing protein [Mangrovicoccus algicola]MBE3639765.1 DUF2927 domain-containing protein [Mangrovicoccus algicola]